MNELENLSSLFSSKFYRIPDYQRGYAWSEDQLEDFWEDLENSKESKHYTGVLSLEIVSSKEKNKSQWSEDKVAREKDTYYIVDGQQRLTTSIILIQVLLESVQGEKWFMGEEREGFCKKYIGGNTESGDKYYYFGYMRDNPSFECLKTHIFGDYSSGNNDTDSIYTRNLKEAKKFFKGKIEKFTKADKEKIFKTLTQNFVFNVYRIASDFDVYVAFETMNNRGKPLSTLELLKNRLIYLSTKIQDCDHLREDINNEWGKIYTMLGKNPNKPLRDDDFLRQHWIMYFEYNRKTDNPHKEFLLNETFTLKEFLKLGDEEKIKKIQDYIKSLAESVKHYYFLHNIEKGDTDYETKYLGDNKEIKHWLEKIYRLGFGSFEPLILAILHKRKEYGISDEEIVEALKEIERFIFLIFGVSQYRTNLKDSSLYGLAKEFYYHQNTLKSIVESMREIRYQYFDLTKFYNHINDNFKKHDDRGFFSWSRLRYFLFEYEESLIPKSQSRKIEWEVFIKPNKKEHETIEHILPQTPNAEWQKMLNGTIGIKNKQERVRNQNIKKLTHALGNLVPLSRAKNSSLLNNPFENKKEKFSNGSYAEIEISKEKQWGKAEIEKRTEKLLDFLLDRWGIDEILEYWDKNDATDWAMEQRECREKLCFRIS